MSGTLHDEYGRFKAHLFYLFRRGFVQILDPQMKLVAKAPLLQYKEQIGPGHSDKALPYIKQKEHKSDFLLFGCLDQERKLADIITGLPNGH